MIRGVHTMFYSAEPDALRAFLRDKLQLPFSDVGDGWLIFDLPEADMGCHPAGDGAPAGTHNISFCCKDIHKAVAKLKSRGVVFQDDITDRGYGLVTHFGMPGGVEVQLYQPLYKKQSKRKPPRRVKNRASVRQLAQKKKPPRKKRK